MLSTDFYYVEKKKRKYYKEENKNHDFTIEILTVEVEFSTFLIQILYYAIL